MTGRRTRAGAARAVAGALALAVAACPALAFVEDTRLVNVSVGAGHSDAVRELRNGGYELSDGTPLSFSDWYASEWRDLRAIWMTEIDRNVGLYWGIGTGERGAKYEIDPSFHLGFVAIAELTERSDITFSATMVLGGWLREKSCVADYGAIGGVQEVNCRLAATPMPPRETLDYLIDEPPVDRIRVSIRYQFRF